MQKWVIPLLVALAFSAGFVARMYTARARTLPLAPTPGTEFMRSSAPAPGSEKASAGASAERGLNREKLVSEMQKIRPQIDVYRQRMDEIGNEFDRAFYALLNPEQRAHFEARQERHAKKKAKRAANEASGEPLTDQEIEKLRREPLWNALWSVAVNWRLEFLCKEYGLDDHQRGQVCGLLKARREKFLDLVDSTPPPTISYSELARQAQKLAVPKN